MLKNIHYINARNDISIYTMDNCRRKKELHLTAGSLNVATSPSITQYPVSGGSAPVAALLQGGEMETLS